MRKTNKLKISPSLVIGLTALLAFLLVFIQADVAIEYMSKGLKLCAASVIPSLFPFMVMSELIVKSGIGLRFSRIVSRPVRSMLGISSAGACACILGAVCGFPIGAKAAVSMYDDGIISKKELERTLTVCNNPGSAFVINTVGGALLGSNKIGILLFFCVILSSLVVGIAENLIFGSVGNHDEAPCALTPHAEVNVSLITDAVKSSAISLLSVCGFVTFFSALVGCIGASLSALNFSENTLSCIFGLFEISSGVGSASESSSRTVATLLCATFCGWSGISVHLQVMSVVGNRKISFKPYLIAKCAQAVISNVLIIIAIKLFLPDIEKMSIPSATEMNGAYESLRICLLFFGASICPILINFPLCIKGNLISTKKFKKFQKNT